MVDENLTKDISIQSSADNQDMLSYVDVHFVNHVFCLRDGVDEEGCFVGNGSGQGIDVVYVCQNEITVKPVHRLSCDVESVGSALVFRDACKVNTFAFTYVRIFLRFGDLPDGKPTENEGGFYFYVPRIDGNV